MNRPATQNRISTAIAIGFTGVLVGALALRFGFIEAPALSQSCGASQESWCGLRSWLGQVFNHKPLGLASLIFGLAAFVSGQGWPGRRWAAVAALLLGTAGLVLYNYDYAAVGTLLGLMAL